MRRNCRYVGSVNQPTIGWLAAVIDATIGTGGGGVGAYRGPAVDDMESYTASAEVNGLNGGLGWTGAYASRPLAPIVAVDDMETYTAAAALNGLNAGTNWSAAYASRP